LDTWSAAQRPLLEDAKDVLHILHGSLAVGDGVRHLGEGLSDELDALLDSVDALLLDVLDGLVQIWWSEIEKRGRVSLGPCPRPHPRRVAGRENSPS